MSLLSEHEFFGTRNFLGGGLNITIITSINYFTAAKVVAITIRNGEMTDIRILIQAADQLIPFKNEDIAQTFLNQYSEADQAALISALYIGRDHIHDQVIRNDYVPLGMAFDRFFITGNAPRWDINPNEFARILYEKNSNVRTYYAAFLRCVAASQYSLQNF